jgi:beta-N-acetylhexosaminidase
MKKAIIFFVFHLSLSAFSLTRAQTTTPPQFLNKNRVWVDSVFATLSPDERIAQLIMVAAVSDVKRAVIDPKTSNPAVIEKLIRENKIGGVVFFQGGPVPQAKLTNY